MQFERNLNDAPDEKLPKKQEIITEENIVPVLIIPGLDYVRVYMMLIMLLVWMMAIYQLYVGAVLYELYSVMYEVHPKILNVGAQILLLTGTVSTIFLSLYGTLLGGGRPRLASLTFHGFMLIFIADWFSVALFWDRVDEELSEQLRKAMENGLKDYTEDFGNAVDVLQKMFKCCGVDGPDDWIKIGKPIPLTCCDTGSSSIIFKCIESTGEWYYKQGCYAPTLEMLKPEGNRLGMAVWLAPAVHLWALIVLFFFRAVLKLEEHAGEVKFKKPKTKNRPHSPPPSFYRFMKDSEKPPHYSEMILNPDKIQSEIRFSEYDLTYQSGRPIFSTYSQMRELQRQRMLESHHAD